ncbi:hypothetical protein Afil01_21080 [Actinorhabdospora filicis]|uniref:Uncharacterized protein n=1 Tax=Actinorhabdospora filicis TaxID=1785913 RepID=A0A9W6W999_9ACTN|nr:hypothetical protein [Actinorhabdospora filicis]GLZ77301.1 hypothetical protein Afil01_21080 [Actinorhabdospora filicis]
MATLTAPAKPAAAKPATARPVPRWANRLAHAVPFMVLPSGVWRILLVAGVPLLAGDEPMHWWEYFYIPTLSLVTEGLGLLTLGLVRPWGERVPRWVPWLRGRTIPRPVAVVPAVLGGIGVLVFCWWALGGHGPGFHGSAWQLGILYACYAPLLLWGPAVLVLTAAYWVRRRPS